MEPTEFPCPYGKYELLERIGDGGMAEVFRARLPGLAGFEKIVVIKRILPHLARKRKFVDMFVREATLAARLAHKNVVQVFELGQLEDGELYIAMEYVNGTDLRHILTTSTKRSLRIPPWFSVYVMAEALDGLAYAHHLPDEDGNERTILHRDVTPSNIFVSRLGEVKLGDFGLARDDSLRSLTRPGQRKGKLSYMSPEQIHASELDERADVFSAGVVLWECLTQRRLFGGRTELEVAGMINDPNRPPPSRYLKDVPEQLDQVVLSALAPDREHRIPNARTFQSLLLDALPQLHAGIRPDDVRAMVERLTGDRTTEPASLAASERSAIAYSGIRFEDVTATGSGPVPRSRLRPETKGEVGIGVRPTPNSGPHPPPSSPLSLPTSDDFWVRRGSPDGPPRTPPAPPSHWRNLSVDLVLEERTPSKDGDSTPEDDIPILPPVEADD